MESITKDEVTEKPQPVIHPKYLNGYQSRTKFLICANEINANGIPCTNSRRETSKFCQECSDLYHQSKS